MNNPEEIKEVVKETYSKIVDQSKDQNESSCCGSGCCSTVDEAIFTEDYSKLQGYNKDADLGLGCGIPTAFARINEGDTVLDLGSGAGNDVFVARSYVGDSGKVIGLDMTEAMINKARENNSKLGYDNVEFILGEIENMPLENETVNVVLSNCVLNLVPDKKKSFEEIYRVMKPGGHFSISDIVLNGELPEPIKKAGEMYAGCVSGAIEKNEYIQLIKDAGFTNIKLEKDKKILLPDDILLEYLTKDEIEEFKSGSTGIFSITVYAEKK
ncbi:MAG TPA: arsenite methyltransferase [Ignavibacteria bacterium]|nr:arsenite methyltransferase [Ignavibacteria bacterium]